MYHKAKHLRNAYSLCLIYHDIAVSTIEPDDVILLVKMTSNWPKDIEKIKKSYNSRWFLDTAYGIVCSCIEMILPHPLVLGCHSMSCPQSSGQSYAP